jgi:effector-binding domain-containing protein
MVEKAGVSSGEVLAVSYPEMKVVRAVHTGPYEDFTISYGILEKYIEENALETTGEVFEFYTVSMPQEPDPARWQTLIAFPLR